MIPFPWLFYFTDIVQIFVQFRRSRLRILIKIFIFFPNLLFILIQNFSYKYETIFTFKVEIYICTSANFQRNLYLLRRSTFNIDLGKKEFSCLQSFTENPMVDIDLFQCFNLRFFDNLYVQGFHWMQLLM